MPSVYVVNPELVLGHGQRGYEELMSVDAVDKYLRIVSNDDLEHLPS